MKKETRRAIVKRDDVRPEYDFKNMKGGVRGKYYKAYRAGHTVKIHKTDGTTAVQHFTLEGGYSKRVKGVTGAAYGTEFNDPRNQNTDQHGEAALGIERALLG